MTPACQSLTLDELLTLAEQVKDEDWNLEGDRASNPDKRVVGRLNKLSVEITHYKTQGDKINNSIGATYENPEKRFAVYFKSVDTDDLRVQTLYDQKVALCKSQELIRAQAQVDEARSIVEINLAFSVLGKQPEEKK